METNGQASDPKSGVETPGPRMQISGLRMLGWLLVIVALIGLVDAATMETTEGVWPSSRDVNALLAVGIDPVMQQVSDPALVGKQIVEAIISAVCLVAGTIFVTRRR